MHNGRMMPRPVPVLTVCSIDPVLRGAAAAGLVCDVPGALVVQYDLHALGSDGAGRLERVVFNGAAVIESTDVDLGHGCMSCAVREDILPTLLRLGAEQPQLLVLVLPVAAEPEPVVRAVRHVGPQGGVRLRASAVVVAAEADALEHDLLGEDTLGERGLALSVQDDRSVAEVLAHQVEYCDVVLTSAPLAAREARLLAHLGTPPWRVTHELLHGASASALVMLNRPHREQRGDPGQVVPAGVPDGDDVWTMELATGRALHPTRLLDRVEDLGRGRLRARGHFWVPTRPGTVCAWDGAGGQVCVGALGPWGDLARGTRIVVTGAPGDATGRTATRVREAFAEVVLTDAEHGRGPAWWAAHADVSDALLGDVSDCA